MNKWQMGIKSMQTETKNCENNMEKRIDDSKLLNLPLFKFSTTC